MTNAPISRPEALAALKARVDALYLNYVFPVLSTLRIGEDASAAAQEAELLAAAKAAGILVRRYILPADVPMSDAEELIREVNVDVLLSALLLIRPMPQTLDPDALERKIIPTKRIAAPVRPGEDPIPTLLSRVVDAAEGKTL